MLCSIHLIDSCFSKLLSAHLISISSLPIYILTFSYLVVISDLEHEKPNESIRENIERNQKVAVVTGSSSGIGYATALRLARSGYVTLRQ
jgi:hypothetical protein